MAGTQKGGKLAATTNKTRYGSDFYARIGAKGGKLGKTGGFAANPALARIAGAKGGRISRRKKAATTQDASATPATATTAPATQPAQEDFDLAA